MLYLLRYTPTSVLRAKKMTLDEDVIDSIVADALENICE